MTKAITSFTLSIDVVEKLKDVENKSRLVDELLKTYFGSAKYGESKKEQIRSKIELLQEQIKREQEQEHKIIIEENKKAEELQAAEEYKIRQEKEKEESYKRRKEQDKIDIELLTKKFGRPPTGTEIVEYHMRNFNK